MPTNKGFPSGLDGFPLLFPPCLFPCFHNKNTILMIYLVCKSQVIRYTPIWPVVIQTPQYFSTRTIEQFSPMVKYSLTILSGCWVNPYIFDLELFTRLWNFVCSRKSSSPYYNHGICYTMYICVYVHAIYT